jgi:hypothetical protein
MHKPRTHAPSMPVSRDQSSAARTSPSDNDRRRQKNAARRKAQKDRRKAQTRWERNRSFLSNHVSPDEIEYFIPTPKADVPSLRQLMDRLVKESNTAVEIIQELEKLGIKYRPWDGT